MPTNIRARESTENIPSSRRVRDVSRTIHYLDPNESPFVLLSKLAGDGRTASNSKFEWIEKSLPTKAVRISGAQTSGDTTIELSSGHAANVYENDLLENVRTHEIFRATSVNTSTDALTVGRGVGSTAAAAMNDGDDVFIVGNANREGGALGTERSVQETYVYNYTQIFKEPFGQTGTQEASENYTGPDRARQRREHSVYHKMDIERAFLWGQRNIDTTSTNQPIRLTGGFLYWVTTNVQTTTTLTEPAMESFCETLFAATGAGNSRVLLAAPNVVSVFDQLAAGRLQTVPSTKTYGIEVLQWLTSHGTLQIVKHRLLVNGAGGTGYKGYALAVDPKRAMYVPLRTRDTELRIDVGTPGDDATTDEYRTEAGFQITNESASSVLKGVTG